MRSRLTGVSTWEDRMAAATAARREAAEAERERLEAAGQARLAVEFPAVEGELGWIEAEGEHRGHRAHIDWWHGNVVTCACGAFMGVFSFALTGDETPPGPCRVCVARGLIDKHGEALG